MWCTEVRGISCSFPSRKTGARIVQPVFWSLYRLSCDGPPKCCWFYFPRWMICHKMNEWCVKSCRLFLHPHNLCHRALPIANCASWSARRRSKPKFQAACLGIRTGQIHPVTIPKLSPAGPWQWFVHYQHCIGYCVRNIWCIRRFGQVLGNIRNINVIRQAFSRTVKRNIRYHFWARNWIHMKMEELFTCVRRCTLHHNIHLLHGAESFLRS